MSNSPKPIDDRMLDRLVDGELSSDEYRQLLVELDQIPDGWRRCAHAFLESQALGLSLPLVMQPVSSLPQKETALKVEKSPPSTAISIHRMETLAAIAAMVAIAFGLGWWISDWGNGDSGAVAPEQPIATFNPHQPGDIPRPGDQQPRYVYVNQWDGLNGSGMPIPIDPNRKFDPDQAWDPTWGMSSKQIQKMTEAGHQLKAENRFIPVSLENGDQVVVPVQDVTVYDQPSLPFH
ncbi:hypothetical protein GC197_08170 [bacterium]|nr:hypothetical protein [bacterium]